MKRCILLVAVVLFTSCTTHKVISSLSISTNVKNDKTITIYIDAIDNDGIESVIIDLKAMNYYDEFTLISGTHWELNRTFSVPISNLENATIKVTIVDVLGNEKITIKPLSI